MVQRPALEHALAKMQISAFDFDSQNTCRSSPCGQCYHRPSGPKPSAGGHPLSGTARWQVLTQQDSDVLLEPPRRRFHGKLYKSLRASGGAGLARLAALRRGATLAPWRVVRIVYLSRKKK